MSEPNSPWWRVGSGAVPRGPAGWRVSLRTILFLLAATTGLVLTLAWMIHRLSPIRPAEFVGFWSDHDPEPSAVPLPWTAADRDAVLALGFGGPQDGKALLTSDPVRLADGLKKLAGGREQRPAVLYVRAAAEIDGKEVRLNSTRTRGGGRRLQDILESFRECDRGHKLLILDVAWADPHPATPDPSAGMVEVLKAVDAVRDPNRTVLAACRPGDARQADQRGHTSSALGRSVFGHYLEEGLRGAADGWNNELVSDGRVTVRELYAYLQDRLGAWSRQNQGPDEQQEPYLAGRAAEPDGDFTLLPVTAAPARPPAPAPVEYPDWLLKSWKDRDAWRLEGRDRSAAASFREQQSRVHAAEWEWRHGIEGAEKRLGKVFEPPKDSAAPTATATVAAAPTAEPKPPGDKSAPPAPPRPLVWDDVKNLLAPPGPTPDRVKQLAQQLSEADGTPPVLFVRRLDRQPPDPAVPVQTVLDLMRLIRESDAEFAARPVFPGLIPHAEALAQARHNAEALFFARGYATDHDVRRAIDEADAALRNFRTARAALTDGERTLDEAVQILTDTVGTARRWPELAETWSNAGNSAARFTDIYLRAADHLPGRNEASEPGLPGGFEQQLRQLREDKNAIVERLESGSTSLTARCRSGFDAAQQLADAVSVFASPRLDGPGRKALWTEASALAARLAAATASPGPKRPPALPERDDAIARLAVDPNALNRDRALLAGVREFRRGWAWEPGGGWASRRDAEWYRWLAGRYRYERDDPIAGDGASEAAALDRQAAAFEDKVTAAKKSAGDQAAGWPAETPAAGLKFVAVPPPVAVLPSDVPASVPVLEFRTTGPEEPVRGAAVFLDDNWFRLDEAPGLGSTVPVGVAAVREKTHYRLALPFSLRPAAGSAPHGMLVRVTTADGRAFHRRVAVTREAAALRFRVTPDPTADGRPLNQFRVRPLADQKFFLRLETVDRRPRTVVVTLAAAGRPPRLSKPIALSGGLPAAVEFPPVVLPPAPPAGGTPPPAAAAPPLAAPFALIVTEANAPDRELYREDFRPRVAGPWEYVTVRDMTFDPRGPAGPPRLGLEFRAKPGTPGPEPAAEIEFPAGPNPPLDPPVGTLVGSVPTDGSPLFLFADGIRTAGRDPLLLTTDVRLDGVPRAFRVQISTPAAGPPLSAAVGLTPAVRVFAADAHRPGLPLAVRVEQDNVPAGVRMELRLLRAENGLELQEAEATRTSVREEAAWLSDAPGPNGAFTLSAGLNDWVVKLPTAGQVGRRIVRARLLDAAGRELARDERPVILDDRLPTDVRFLDPPRQAAAGTVLTVRAKATAPPAGLVGVRFALGGLVDGKLPDAVPRAAGGPSATDPTVWEGQVTVPAALLGPAELRAEFVSKVGLVGTAAARVEVLAATDAAKPKPATIAGVVKEGDSPREGLDVVLTDDKGVEKARTTTDADGRFKFENLPAGKYSVGSARPDGVRKGSTAVEVKAGDEADVTIKLFL